MQKQEKERPMVSSRVLKFRVWIGDRMEYNVTTGKFGTFYVNPGPKGDGLDEHDSACLSPFNTIYHKNIPVMQFTGLLDKNGKEIYEGDIVQWPKGQSYLKGKVYYEGASFEVENFYMTSFDIVSDAFGEGLRLLEIIGNIYENPELLK